ncbi:hypothetical protein CsSME_00007026 [Camellia sinensis var. sinensis]
MVMVVIQESLHTKAPPEEMTGTPGRRESRTKIQRKTHPLVALLSGGVIQEDTPKRPRIQLTTGRRMVMNKAHTPKGFGRNGEGNRSLEAEQNLKRSLFMKNLGRKPIDEEGSSENRLPPIGSRNAHFKG